MATFPLGHGGLTGSTTNAEHFSVYLTGMEPMSIISAKSKQDALHDLTGLDGKTRERMAWSDTSLLRSLLVFLGSQTWMKHSHSTSADSLLSDDNDDAVRTAAWLRSRKLWRTLLHTLYFLWKLKEFKLPSRCG